MREVRLPESELPLATASFLACVAAILELALEDIPRPAKDEDPATGWTVTRWLGGLGLGLARIADVGSFTWPGPWIGRVPAPERYVVMYGVPSGVVWDPAGGPEVDRDQVEDGFIVAASDIALAMPPRPDAPAGAGVVETLAVAVSAGEPARLLDSVRALAGRGLDGDRHVTGTGTFPSGMPGSALTLNRGRGVRVVRPAA